MSGFSLHFAEHTGSWPLSVSAADTSAALHYETTGHAGPTGPTGPTGPMGPTGAIGPTGQPVQPAQRDFPALPAQRGPPAQPAQPDRRARPPILHNSNRLCWTGFIRLARFTHPQSTPRPPPCLAAHGSKLRTHFYWPPEMATRPEIPVAKRRFNSQKHSFLR